MRVKITLSCLAAILLVGCQTGQAPIGQGPITLTPQVSNYYKDKYLKNGPVVFFVSEDGGYATYVWCPQTAMCSTRGGSKWSAYGNCEKKSGKKCFIFDEDGSVVWDGPVSYGNTSVSDENTSEQDRSSPDHSSGESRLKNKSRPIAVQWENKFGIMAGIVEFTDKKSGLVYFDLPDGSGRCNGRYQFAGTGDGKGVWSMACPGQISASGTFTGNGRGKGSVGAGMDTEGNKVEFRVGAERKNTTSTATKTIVTPETSAPSANGANNQSNELKIRRKAEILSCVRKRGADTEINRTQCTCVIDAAISTLGWQRMDRFARSMAAGFELSEEEVNQFATIIADCHSL